MSSFGRRLRRAEKVKRGGHFPALIGRFGIYTYEGKQYTAEEIVALAERLGYDTDNLVLINDDIPRGVSELDDYPGIFSFKGEGRYTSEEIVELVGQLPVGYVDDWA